VPMRAMKWRPVDEWVTRIVSKATGNLGAVQILLGAATYCPQTSD